MRTTVAGRGTVGGALIVLGMLAGCGGGGNDNAAPAGASLSANQQIYEELTLGAGAHQLAWNLALAGGQVSNVNYAWSEAATLTASPTTGPQTSRQTPPDNLTSTLSVVTPTPTRILKNGVILVAPSVQAAYTTTYTGSDIQVDALATDGTTVIHSNVRTDYTSVDLTGTLGGSPADFRQYYANLFFNPAVLKLSTPFAPGAKYVKYTSKNLGDRYNAFDCIATTTDANISPCATQTTLTAALNAGIASTSDGKTYRLADGQVSTVGGIPVWIAAAPRPSAVTSIAATEYRIYFQLNNNVYTGSLVKDGTALNNVAYPFSIRLNKAARDSMASAFAI